MVIFCYSCCYYCSCLISTLAIYAKVCHLNYMLISCDSNCGFNSFKISFIFDWSDIWSQLLVPSEFLWRLFSYLKLFTSIFSIEMVIRIFQHGWKSVGIIRNRLLLLPFMLRFIMGVWKYRDNKNILRWFTRLGSR